MQSCGVSSESLLHNGFRSMGLLLQPALIWSCLFPAATALDCFPSEARVNGLHRIWLYLHVLKQPLH